MSVVTIFMTEMIARGGVVHGVFHVLVTVVVMARVCADEEDSAAAVARDDPRFCFWAWSAPHGLNVVAVAIQSCFGLHHDVLLTVMTHPHEY